MILKWLLTMLSAAVAGGIRWNHPYHRAMSGSTITSGRKYNFSVKHSSKLGIEQRRRAVGAGVQQLRGNAAEYCQRQGHGIAAMHGWEIVGDDLNVAAGDDGNVQRLVPHI